MNKNDFDFVVGAEVRQTKVVYVLKCWLRYYKFIIGLLQNGTNRIIYEYTSVIRRLKNYLLTV